MEVLRHLASTVGLLKGATLAKKSIDYENNIIFGEKEECLVKKLIDYENRIILGEKEEVLVKKLIDYKNNVMKSSFCKDKYRQVV
jgi:hypothetical protein